MSRARDLADLLDADGDVVASALDNAITEVGDDTTPQLGGNLDLNSSDITGTGDVNITGSVTATSFSGDGSQLTNLAAGSINAVASGALSNGDLVIINADGTVSVVEETVTPGLTVGTAGVVETAGTQNQSIAFDSSNNKIVVAYRDNDNSGFGTAAVGTVDGTSITFGTPVVFDSIDTRNTDMAFDSVNNKVVISYSDYGGTSDGTAIVGSVSGNSITFGSEVVFESGRVPTVTAIVFDPNAEKVVIAYENFDDAGSGNAIVGTVSGTSISFGSSAEFDSNVESVSSCFDSANNKVVISYRDVDNSNFGTAVVGTVSGTSISFGTPVVFESADSNFIGSDFDSNENKVVIAYEDNGNTAKGTAIVGTVSGTSISFGTPVVFEDGVAQYNSVTFDPGANKILIAYEDDLNSDYGTLALGTVSGTSISFDAPVLFAEKDSSFIDSVYDSENGAIVIHYRNITDGTTEAVVVKTQTLAANLTSENFIGISNADYADGATATIQTIGSVDDAQTSLTAGQHFYVQTDGTLSVTPDNPSVFAGTAISSTKLIIKG